MRLRYFINLSVILLLMICSCTKEKSNPNVVIPTSPTADIYSVNNHYILKNDLPFEVKGVVYVPGYPGTLPWETEQNTNLPLNFSNSINQDMINIKVMGANTVRLWGAPKKCYESIKAVGGLSILQTIWINGDQVDFQDPTFKSNTKTYIRSVIDRIYSVYTKKNPPIIAYLVGNELSASSIRNTNLAHPNINSYSGEYVFTNGNINATEAFIAEMADYVKDYEFTNYGRVSLVSYSNDIRTADMIDTEFLDFRCHNVYSYSVPEYRPQTQVGSGTGTLFQGWVEELKGRYPSMPLLLTEMGLSVSPNANHVGAPNYGYGGNTEQEQASGLLSNINDLQTSRLPIAGACVHEYLDSWWKYDLQDSYTQDPNDVEEWFGLVKIVQSGGWYITQFRPSYLSLKQVWGN
jgi:hypothetical protein